MPKLFEDDTDNEDEITFNTDNEYAKKYNEWRKKEELHKLKMKYGEDAVDSSGDDTSSSSDDEGLGELNEEDDKKFFRMMACLIGKRDASHIYAEEKNEGEVERRQKKKKKKKDEPMFLKDYERKLLLEKGGIVSESEDEEAIKRTSSPTYVEEQRQLKESLKAVVNSIDDSDDEDIFKPRQDTAKEIKSSDYRLWLAGKIEHLDDKELEDELRPLRDYWNDPNLDEKEKFLRDYFIEQKYLEKKDENYTPKYDEIIHDSDEGLSADEKELEEAEKFEYKYNFRFEEPDPEYIKTYPRTMGDSLRRTDDRRKIKRAEIKERKQKEKQQKMEELKLLQKLKKEEIEDKIAKLKEITGGTDIGFKDEDIDGDFDPDLHDKRMQALFNDEFYQGPEGDQKPEFPELDEELEIENWNKWKGDNEDEENANAETNNEPRCEDESFNMDCDYDPQTAKKELIEGTRRTKKRKRKSKFAEAISTPKPQFDPTDKTYEEYLDEYYKLDCEDIIGDVPCRFKYRKVEPNSFGLTIEEILMANDRELNKWCSLKKTMQHRPEHVEKYDQIAYSRKAQNVALKRKILPSLFKGEDNEDDENSTDMNPSKARLDKFDRNKSATTTKRTQKSNNSINTDNNQPSSKEFQNNKHENCESNTEHENELSTKKKKKKNTERRDENITDKSELTNLINTDDSQPPMKEFQNDKHENCESNTEHENQLSTNKKKEKKKNTERRDKNINDKSELTNLINTDNNQPSTKGFQNNKHKHCESNPEHENELSTKKKKKKKKHTERRDDNISGNEAVGEVDTCENDLLTNHKSELTNSIHADDNQPSTKGFQNNKHENSESNTEHENKLSAKSKKKKKKHTERKDESINGNEAVGKVNNYENELLTNNKKNNKRHSETIDENVTQNEADIQSESKKNIPEIENGNGNSNHNTNKKKKKKKKKKKSSLEATNSTSTAVEMNNHPAQQIRQEKMNRKRKHSEVQNNDNDSQNNPNKIPKLNKNKKKHKSDSVQTGLSDARLVSFGLNPKKYKNKLKYKK